MQMVEITRARFVCIDSNESVGYRVESDSVQMDVGTHQHEDDGNSKCDQCHYFAVDTPPHRYGTRKVSISRAKVKALAKISKRHHERWQTVLAKHGT